MLTIYINSNLIKIRCLLYFFFGDLVAKDTSNI